MIAFYKYHGAGNDFIVIDNRSKSFDVSNTEQIKTLCHRRFGIGADGILLVEDFKEYDFSMVYINSDGSMGSMCGNGGRCIVHFAHHVLGIVKDIKKVKFLAVDGLHEAEIVEDDVIKLKMQDVDTITNRNGHIFLCSGTTAHNVVFVEDIASFPVVLEGQKLQKVETDPKGVNVNFVELIDGMLSVRTYERGVWDETMACGTGATSVAIACHSIGKLKENICNIKMPGGNLEVTFQKMSDSTYQNIWLTGEAKCVFKGTME